MKLITFTIVVTVLLLFSVSIVFGENENHLEVDDACEKSLPCNTINDDVNGEFTTVEAVDAEILDAGMLEDTSADEQRILRRQKRSNESTPQEPLEKDFQFTDDKKYFYDLLDGSGAHDKSLFHKQSPDGYAEADRTKLLLFDVMKSAYPPFTYRGLYGRNNWHKIPIESLMKKRNKSFMMLEHECEQKEAREEEKKCAKTEYIKLPSCKSQADQSPMDIDTFRARDSALKEFEFRNLKDSQGKAIKFPFMMSVPWDGTDILTVELLGNKPPPSVEKGSISGQKLHLERIHIHFGENETVGSEHTLNNLTYSMEIQFIFTKRKSADGVRQPSDLQYWDLLMQYYTKAGEPNRHKNVHIIAFWVKVIEDEKFKSGRGDWNDPWNKEASNAFGALARAARKFWAIHNTLQDPNSPNTGSENPSPNMTETGNTTAGSSKRRRQASDGDGDTNGTAPVSPSNGTGSSPPPPSTFKYRAVISTGSEALELGAFFPPQVLDARQKKQRDSIYYNYKGGITHPPCFSYVEWDIYDRPLYIPTSMWFDFLYMHSEFDDTKYIAGNYRMPVHVYVEALDSKRTESWTSKNEEERQKVLAKMAKRDLRRSKPSGRDSDNYYYTDLSSTPKTPSELNPLIATAAITQILFRTMG